MAVVSLQNMVFGHALNCFATKVHAKRNKKFL